MLDAMRQLGMQQQEELKEEPEQRLQRLMVYFLALVEGGTLTLSSRPLPSQIVIPPVAPRYFSWWNGGALNASLVQYSDRDGVVQVQAPGQDQVMNMEYWISCQVGDDELF